MAPRTRVLTSFPPLATVQQPATQNHHQPITMADDEDIAALVIDNGSGMCKGTFRFATAVALRLDLLMARANVSFGRLLAVKRNYRGDSVTRVRSGHQLQDLR